MSQRELRNGSGEIMRGLAIGRSAGSMCSELAAGPHASVDADERARRQDRVERAGGSVRSASVANELRLYTRNPKDFTAPQRLVDVVTV